MPTSVPSRTTAGDSDGPFFATGYRLLPARLATALLHTRGPRSRECRASLRTRSLLARSPIRSDAHRRRRRLVLEVGACVLREVPPMRHWKSRPATSASQMLRPREPRQLKPTSSTPKPATCFSAQYPCTSDVCCAGVVKTTRLRVFGCLSLLRSSDPSLQEVKGPTIAYKYKTSFFRHTPQSGVDWQPGYCF